ncbi:hypothetical protein N0M98_13890 [Paenibacillus doosanensis]|nr:hypothetical protein [Paenibacillus doosanensis]MCS7461237.1 hypothetical protein [Paenibacillus doosanensis]
MQPFILAKFIYTIKSVVKKSTKQARAIWRSEAFAFVETSIDRRP